MIVKSALSALALTIALAGASYAQGTTINGAAVSEQDRPAVQERCDALSNAAATESLTETSDDASDDTTESGANAGSGSDSSESNGSDANAANDAMTANPPAVNEVENATSTIDLATIDLQACIDGGFVTQ